MTVVKQKASAIDTKLKSFLQTNKAPKHDRLFLVEHDEVKFIRSFIDSLIHYTCSLDSQLGQIH